MKTCLNRIISKVFRWMYLMRPKHLRALFLIILLLWIFVTFLHRQTRSFGNAKKAGNQIYFQESDFVSEDESYLLLYLKSSKTEKFTNDISQVNSKDDFLQLKLRRLISVSYVTSKDPSSELFHDYVSLTSYKHLVSELGFVINVQKFYSNLLGCEDLQKFKFQSAILETSFSVTYEASFDGSLFATQSVRANIDELVAQKCHLNNVKEVEQFSRCFLLKNRRLLQEYLFLSELHHPNIAQLRGVCFKKDENKDESFLGLTVIKETGKFIEITLLKQFNWNQRLKICFDLINLANYLSKSPLGPIYMSNLSPINFLISQENTIKLTNFDQELSTVEKPCKSDKDCFLNNNFINIRCFESRCKSFNEKLNMLQIYKFYIDPLLKHQIPTNIENIFLNFIAEVEAFRYHSLTDVATKLKSFTTVEISDEVPPVKKLSHDGVQVDSWEQHEAIVSINEVMIPNKVVQDQVNQNLNAIENKNEKESLSDYFGYTKIENADFPGRFDYYCPHSKAEWGCVVSLQALADAASKCDQDSKCRAFVTMPHLRKEGWIIAIMKSDNSNPVDHAGTTVYVKVKGSGGVNLLNTDNRNNDTPLQNTCWKTVVDKQFEERNEKETALLNACGWRSIKDSMMQEIVVENTVKDANDFKPARGKMASGGQMYINIEFGSSLISGTFNAKSGPEEYHLAQLAAYHLDRMMGLYKTTPVFLRTLSEKEMNDAGFPKDIGGNLFDKYLPLKNSDKSLAGTILPSIVSKTTFEHYITIPKLDFITNAVTPFTKRQLDDMEYLILIWLTSLPMPKKGFLCVDDKLLVHTNMEEAFKGNPSEEVLGYFYNCQFPQTFNDVIQHFHSENCNIGDQLISHIKTSYPNLSNNQFNFGSLSLSDIVTRNANRLLEIVDTCLQKFDKENVFFKS